MILFYAEHNGAMSNYISMRFKMHSNDKVVLLMHQAPPKVICDRLVKNGVFDKIVDVPIHITPKMTLKANTPDEVECEITSFYDDLFAKNSISLDNIDKIYYSNDTVTCFGLYLCIKGIRYNCIEMLKRQISTIPSRYNCGGLVTPAFLEKMYEYDTLIRYPEKFKLLDNYYVYPNSEIPQGFEDKVIVTDFLEMMDSLEEADYRKIIKSFDFSDYVQIETPNTAIVASLGTGRLGALIGKVPADKQAAIFQIMMDYYLPDNVKVMSKAHPRRPMKLVISNGDIMEIPKWFPIEYIVFYKYLNVEYLLLADDGLKEKLIGRFQGKLICPHDAFYRNQFYLMLNRYYATLAILDTLPEYNVNICGIDKDAFLCFAQNVGNPNRNITVMSSDDTLENKLVITAPFSRGFDNNVRDMIARSTDNTILVFVDFLNRFAGYDLRCPENINSFIVVKIEKEAICDENKLLVDTCTEYVYVYCKNANIRKKIYAFNIITKELPYSGIKLKISVAEEWEKKSILQEIRIKALEKLINDKEALEDAIKCISWDYESTPLNIDKNIFIS